MEENEQLTRRGFLRWAASTAAAPFLAACGKDRGPRVVNFFNWSMYIGKDTLARFTERTGIAVNYEEFADEEEMFAKLRSGARGYDLIVATDYMIPRLKALGLIDPFPHGGLKNAGNIDSKFRDAPFDPDNSHTIPYLWGTTGIGYNKAKVGKAPTSWLDLWDARHAGRISMLDSARDCLSTALLIKGYPETTDEKRLFDEAKRLLLKQRPLVKQYTSSTYIDGLLAGELHLAMAWSGDVLQGSRENPQLDYVIPKEGSYMWVDNLCLTRGSQHREDTLLLVDYLLESETGAAIANAVRYATPNAAALKLTDQQLRDDPRVFPPASVARRLRFHALLDPNLSEVWSQAWSDVKVGS